MKARTQKTLLSLFLISSFLFSQSDQPFFPNDSDEPPLECIPPPPCCPPINECCFPLDVCTEVQRVCSTVTLRHIEGRELGYCNGYTTLEGLLFPFCNCSCVWPFLDVRVHYFNNNEWAGNAGLGFRYFNSCCNVAYGFNAYYDFRTNCDRDLFFQQVGIGFERLGACWDLRVNGYFPFDEKKKIKHCHFDYPGGFFIDQKRYQEALMGGDIEVGHYFIHSTCWQLYGAIGPYVYGGTDCNHSFVGGRARAFLSYTRYFTLEGMVTYDSEFKTRGQGMIAIHIPFGCCPRRGLKQDILSQRIYRDEIIVLDSFCKWNFNY